MGKLLNNLVLEIHVFLICMFACVSPHCVCVSW